jgi:hypothetical protein
MRNNTKSQRVENVQECKRWWSRGGKVVNVYKCRNVVVQEEIGTLRFGWLEKVAGRGWELPKVTPHRLRLNEPETFR